MKSFRCGQHARWTGLALGILLSFHPPAAPAAETTAQNTLTNKLADIDALRQKGRYAEALEQLKNLLALDSGQAEVLWRQSWTKVDMGEAAEDAAATARFYEEALTDARAAIAANPTNAHAHLVCAIAAGRLAQISPTRRKVKLSRQVKQHADLALAQAPNLAAAYHVRGIWHREVAAIDGFSRALLRIVYGGLPDASYEASVVDFEKSIELDEYVGDRVELAQTCLAMGNKERARSELKRALALPIRMPQDRKHHQTARQLLDDL